MDNALAKIIFLLITKNILIIKYIHPNWLIFDTKQKSNYRIDVQARKKYLISSRKKIEIESTKWVKHEGCCTESMRLIWNVSIENLEEEIRFRKLR